MVDKHCPFCIGEDCNLLVDKKCNQYDLGACPLFENTLITSDLLKYCKGKIIKDISINNFQHRVIYITFEDNTILEIQSHEPETFISTLYPKIHLSNGKILDLTIESYNTRKKIPQHL